jgi:DNA sulfur modification protein DndB
MNEPAKTPSPVDTVSEAATEVRSMVDRNQQYITFPCVRGIQAAREFYTSMVPMKIVADALQPAHDELDIRDRCQRRLNKARVPIICKYIVDNSNDYVLPSITVLIDSVVEFVPCSDDPRLYNVGQIRIPATAKLTVSDGQHRCAAIKAALLRKPELMYETVPCTLFVATTTERAQQMFTDINRHVVRPSSSVNLAFDRRDPLARLSLRVASQIPLFADLVDFERSGLSSHSPALFTLSALYRATNELLRAMDEGAAMDYNQIVLSFWREVCTHMPDWIRVHRGEVTASELRARCLSGHAVALVAIGRVGNCLVSKNPDSFGTLVQGLETLDWRRSNDQLWRCRTIYHGKVAFSTKTVTLVANAIKFHLGIPLSEDELRLELQEVRPGPADHTLDSLRQSRTTNATAATSVDKPMGY